MADELITSGATTPDGAPAAPAAPTPPAPAPAAPAATPTPSPSADSGSDDSSLGAIAKSLNLTEVIFGILGSAALFYTIYYFKYNLDASKGFQSGIQNKMDELSIKIADIDSVLGNKTDTQGFDGGFY